MFSGQPKCLIFDYLLHVTHFKHLVYKTLHFYSIMAKQCIVNQLDFNFLFSLCIVSNANYDLPRIYKTKSS